MFYQSVMASVLFFGIACWGGHNRASDTHDLDRLVRRAGSVVGSQLEGVEVVARKRTASKLDSILKNPSHPLHVEITGYWSKRGNNRFIYPARRCVRLGRSFVPVALTIYNDSHNGRLARPDITVLE